jgi:hypothetical protein
MSVHYPSDLTDEQWELIRPCCRSEQSVVVPRSSDERYSMWSYTWAKDFHAVIYRIASTTSRLRITELTWIACRCDRRKVT